MRVISFAGEQNPLKINIAKPADKDSVSSSGLKRLGHDTVTFGWDKPQKYRGRPVHRNNSKGGAGFLYGVSTAIVILAGILGGPAVMKALGNTFTPQNSQPGLPDTIDDTASSGTGSNPPPESNNTGNLLNPNASFESISLKHEGHLNTDVAKQYIQNYWQSLINANGYSDSQQVKLFDIDQNGVFDMNADAEYLANLIDQNAATFDVKPDVIIGVMQQESEFKITATSRANAVGLMQIMQPAIDDVNQSLSMNGMFSEEAKELIRSNRIDSPSYDPVKNIIYGSAYLHLMDVRYGHSSARAAICGYNGGPGLACDPNYEPGVKAGYDGFHQLLAGN